ncbi:hypothetical protein BC829DRAFT_26894 [Chytridium lagenaria]|nr:hypothetical protein BC829DRAFT_26894 [Chytridium lagenaria]
MMVCHDGLGGDGDEVAPRTLDLESTQLDASSSLLESSSTTDLESMQPAASLSLLASTSGDVETQYVALETVNGQCDLPLAVFDVMTDETTAGHCFTDVASSLVGTVEYDSAASSWELTDPTPPSPTMDDTPHKRPSSSPVATPQKPRKTKDANPATHKRQIPYPRYPPP